MTFGAMPLMTRFGIPGTARASFALYNRPEDVTALADAIARAQALFGTVERDTDRQAEAR